MRFGVAMVLAVAVLVSGCSMGGQPTVMSTSAAPVANPVSDPWAVLRTRPLRLSPVATGRACPGSPVVHPDARFGAGLGSGPVYAVTGGQPLVAGSLKKVLWVARPTYDGPVLIRGARIDGAGPLLLDSGANRTTTAAVTVHPTNRADGYALCAEIALDATGTTTGAPWRAWPSYTYVAEPGCYAWQVDGSGFTEVIVTSAA